MLSSTSYALLAVLLLLTILAMSFFTSKNHFTINGRTIIITGGSQGLGLALAQKLAAKGANVVIVAQTVEKLERAITQIRSRATSSSQRFLHLSYDLRLPESATQILSRVTTWNHGRPADVVWCCAGSCHPGFFADISIEDQRGQMDTVYWSCAYIARATMNLWTQPSDSGSKAPDSVLPRHLIFTCSTLAFFPVAGYTAYTTAKAAMRALADSLQQEVAVYNGARQRGGVSAPDADIKIHTIFPMGILTPGFENEERLKPELTSQLEEDDKPQTADDVADAAIKGLERGQYMISTMLLGHLMKGAGMGGSLRSGFADVLWSWVASIVILFVGPDFVSKCKRWGRERGMVTGPVGK